MAYYVGEGAIIRGHVTMGENASVWFNAVVRADQAPVTIGKGSNVQDCYVIHEGPNSAVVLGENVTIGHGVILHGCVIGDNTLVGMGSVVLNGASIGRNCLIGAGSVVPQNAIIPDNSFVSGNPAKVLRELSEAEIAYNVRNAIHYADMAKTELEFMME